jgi:uncharacterized protein YndB with AHSA1/START domain
VSEPTPAPSATSVADVSTGTIHAQIDIDAPAAEVFEALTDPAQLASWWGSPDSYRTFDWKLDLRVGGAWSCQAENPHTGQRSTVVGEYLELDPPRRLAYTWLPSWDNVVATTVRIELDESAGRTRVRVVHTGFEGRAQSCQGHAAGWIRVLGWLAAGLARAPASGSG